MWVGFRGGPRLPGSVHPGHDGAELRTCGRARRLLEYPQGYQASTSMRVQMPNAMKRTPETLLRRVWGNLSLRSEPPTIASPFAASIPRLAPNHTMTKASYRAARDKVASWVLSPISAIKKATATASTALRRRLSPGVPSPVSSVSG